MDEVVRQGWVGARATSEPPIVRQDTRAEIEAMKLVGTS